MVGMMFITENSSNYSFRWVYLDQFDDPSGDDSDVEKITEKDEDEDCAVCICWQNLYTFLQYVFSFNQSVSCLKAKAFVENVFCKDFYVNLLCNDSGLVMSELPLHIIVFVQIFHRHNFFVIIIIITVIMNRANC